MPGDGRAVRRVRAGRLAGLVADGNDLIAIVGPDADPDRLLTSARCRLLKFQRKVIVGRIETAIGPLYVKRYNTYALRVALASFRRPSPAVQAFHNALALAALGVATARPVAAVEFRRCGLLTRSFFLTHEVAAAETVNIAWGRILAFANPRARRETRRAFARALGAFFRDLHEAGVYHADLKDVNVVASGPLSAPRFTLLDLERVRIAASVPRGRRVKNLVQLARTLGPLTTRADRARWLTAYLGDAGREERRHWARMVLRAQRRKERLRGRPARGQHASVTCTIVCQDEASQIGQCLDSAAWCDEIIVVDGGSRDATVEIARRYTDRIVHNPWPGYRAQKQFALEHSGCEWVLNLDADERVSDELSNEIRRALVAVPLDVDGFAIPRLVSYLGRWWYRGGWYPRPVERLVRRSRTTWG
ncbi:MAG: lipopolysaccharide kinase InaA family protein, partial [Candidatus Binatia bacterium]